MDSVNETDGGRKARGQQIAAKGSIRRTPKGFIVPSQSGFGKYAVIVEGTTELCTCPDFETRRQRCKHVWAVVIQQEFNFAEGTVTETVTVTKTVERKTYPQTGRRTTARRPPRAISSRSCSAISAGASPSRRKSAAARAPRWPIPCSARP